MMADPMDYNGEQLFVVSVLFLALTYVAVGLRVFVRIFITQSFLWDDLCMLVAQVGDFEAHRANKSLRPTYARVSLHCSAHSIS